MRTLPALTALTLILTVTACSSASYSERMAYLRKTANRGVETHNLLYSQGAEIDAKRCSAAYDGLGDDDIPSDVTGSSPSREWLDQVRQFFVDSCVTGLPKPVPGQATTPPPAPSPVSPTPTKAA